MSGSSPKSPRSSPNSNRHSKSPKSPRSSPKKRRKYSNQENAKAALELKLKFSSLSTSSNNSNLSTSTSSISSLNSSYGRIFQPLSPTDPTLFSLGLFSHQWFLTELSRLFTYREYRTFSLLNKKILNDFIPVRDSIILAKETTFKQLILRHQVELVLKIYEQGLEKNIDPTFQKNRIISLAVGNTKANFDLMKFIIHDSRIKPETWPYITICLNGYTDLLKLMLESDKERVDELKIQFDKDNDLHYIVQNDRTGIVLELAKFKIIDENHALTFATLYGKVEMARLLLNYIFSESQLPSSKSITPTLIKFIDNSEFIKEMLGKLPPMYFSQEEVFQLAFSAANVRSLQLIFARSDMKASLDSKQIHKIFATQCWRRGPVSEEIANFVLEFCLDADLRNTDFQSACQTSKVTTVKALIARKHFKLDISADSDLAFRTSAARGHWEIVELLLNLGANPGAQNFEALRLASQAGHTKVVQLIQNHKSVKSKNYPRPFNSFRKRK